MDHHPQVKQINQLLKGALINNQLILDIWAFQSIKDQSVCSYPTEHIIWYNALLMWNLWTTRWMIILGKGFLKLQSLEKTVGHYYALA